MAIRPNISEAESRTNLFVMPRRYSIYGRQAKYNKNPRHEDADSNLRTNYRPGQSDLSYDCFTCSGISGKKLNSFPIFVSISDTVKIHSLS